MGRSSGPGTRPPCRTSLTDSRSPPRSVSLSMRLSLSLKLSLGPLSVAALTGLLAFGYLLPRMEDSFDQQGQDLGSALPSTLASTLMELLAAHQHAAVQSAIDDVASKSRVAYVAVIDPGGELIAVSG